MTSSIPCFLAINDAYVRHACVMIASAACNSKSLLRFYILNASLSAESKREIEAVREIHNFEVEYVRIDKRLIEDVQIRDEHISVETCYRLLIPTIFPEMEKAIYLDADMVVRHDLAELWAEDVGDFYAGVVEDFIHVKIKNYDSIFPSRRYFNAGVLLLNLRKIRKDIPFARFVEIESRHRDSLRHQDQDVLNIALGNNVKYLPLKWNVTFLYFNPRRRFPKTLGFTAAEVVAARENPAIVHYIGSLKPWRVPCGFMAPPYVKEYFKYLDMVTGRKNYAEAVKKFPRVRDFFAYWWRHPFFFVRPKTYALMRARRKFPIESI
ncbi:lipopolysaccharide biosynthesis glycosyltransferase [Ereboglobus sp. PH5-10]|uniref:glycosyltransferase family 8 protein n=1 Tax=Ereboglobus sp. PH5-10 TaxID=2940629 RepID=UPI002406E81D|nr:glycosyltransferase family 8 protein [Ereboglobus sp. PH5-10]MDF9827086.1 lipopolysaccharide biosynthesis glycosyltransferase [Ereboglobus sp. PH5-10]